MRQRDEKSLREAVKGWSEQKLTRELKEKLEAGWFGVECYKNISESHIIFAELHKRLKGRSK